MSIARLFLSASVPLRSRNPTYFASADAIAIRDAIRAITMVVVERRAQLIFGGHPAITPMIRLQLSKAGLPVGNHVVVYQSRFFEHSFPADNAAFERVELIDAIANDSEASLRQMREAMLHGLFDVGLFVGGMEGVEEEYELFRKLHPQTLAFPIASTGAAAANIFDRELALQRAHPELRDELSYLTLIRDLLDVALSSPRH